MIDRKIILKCHIGSYLYGTNGPDSDVDYSGIFLPSTQDLLGMQNCPTEWSQSEKLSEGPRNEAGDTDCKFYSLRRWMQLAADGQPGQLELLFVPYQNIQITKYEYSWILGNKKLFLSRQGIRPFIGFALAQAHKAVIKGENLNILRELWEAQQFIDTTKPLSEVAEIIHETMLFPLGRASDGAERFRPLPVITNDHGYRVVEVAGRKYDINLKTRTFLNNVSELINRYGTRSATAAEKGFDYKSLSHAYRLLSEAEEFLLTGNITFPRPDAEFLLSVKNGQYRADYFSELTEKLDYLRQVVEPKSSLPEKPDRSAIEELCIEMHNKHLRGT